MARPKAAVRVRDIAVANAARLSVMTLGVALVGLGEADHDRAVRLWLMSMGTAVFVLAALISHIKRYKSKYIGDIETREPPGLEGAQLAAELAAPDDLDPAEVDVPGDEVVATRYSLGQLALVGLLDFDADHVVGASYAQSEGRLYVYDELRGLLLPTVEPDDANSHGWPPGHGVVGTAYSENAYVLATGEHTHNGTYGLTEDERRRYADLTAVAAVPVANAAGRTIAILAVSTRQTDHVYESNDAYIDMLLLADLVARALVDLLEWFSDDDQ